MVSRNLQSIIDKYNEIGTIVEHKGSFYWFNGHRYEYWCTKQKNISKYVYYKMHLYVLINDIFHKRTPRKLYQCYYDDKVQLLMCSYRSCFYNGMIYRLNGKHSICRIDKFPSVIKIGQPKPSSCGRFLFGYQNHIYVISNETNEKMNLSTGIWSDFKKAPSSIFDGCFINDKFYCLIANCHYDPTIDKWKSSINHTFL